MFYRPAALLVLCARLVAHNGTLPPMPAAIQATLSSPPMSSSSYSMSALRPPMEGTYPFKPRKIFRSTKIESHNRSKHFSHDDIPVTIGLIVDNSGSMRSNGRA